MFEALISFARRVRNFIGFATFLVVGGIFLFVYSFSQGSFDVIIDNFRGLSPDQFFWLILIFLFLIFIILLILIFLSFKGRGITSNKNNLSRLEETQKPNFDRKHESHLEYHHELEGLNRGQGMEKGDNIKYPDKTTLRKQIIKHFSREEFETLCTDFQTSVEVEGLIVSLTNFGEKGFEYQVRDMLDWLKRRNLYESFIDVIRSQRGNIF